MLRGMSDLDAFALAARQIEIDRDATAQIPLHFARKKARLSPSPHAFLRGSAPLFYEILSRRPELGAGPEGDGWIVGDMHLENVGAYRDAGDDVVFGLDYFDEAAQGPLRLDVLRLAVSVLLAARGIRVPGREAITELEHLIGAYLKALAGGPPPPRPAVVSSLLLQARDRNKRELLDERAPLGPAGKRRFARGERYLDLPPELEARVPALLAAYVAALGDHAPGRASEWAVEDAALRAAGIGTLGVVRIAMLVRDHAGDPRLVELKEAKQPSIERLAGLPTQAFTHPGERVVEAARALLSSPPRHLAAVALDGRSFAGRRLFPQEDKLTVDSITSPAALDERVTLIGHLLGAAHAHGLAALRAPAPKPWSAADVAAILDHAVELAGMMEGAYLAWVRRVG